MSIVQGGSSFPVLLPAACHYLTTGEYLGQIKDDNSVPDPQIRHLLQQVRIIIPKHFPSMCTTELYTDRLC